MKILVVCQNYYPEPFRINDICEELVKRGHKVSVITGVPNYPIGEIYEGYKKGEKRDEIINGVQIHRTFTIGRKGGVLKRFLNYYSFAISSKKYAKKLKEEFDVVFVNQLSPVMMANAGIAYAKRHKVPLVMYVMDLWPASLAAGGIGKGNFIYKHYYKVSKNIYKKADKLLVTSSMFKGYLEEQFDIDGTKIEYLPQYAEDTFCVENCKKIPNDTVDLMFAGNVGYAQSVGTIIKAAEICKDIKNLNWHIVGDGKALDDCKRTSEELGLSSVIFHGRKPVEEMPKYYEMADAMMVAMQKDEFISLTLPGKVQSYLAAGKPIIGAIDGETAKVIEEAECGYCSPAEDYEKLAANVRKFCEEKEATNGESVIRFGANAAKYYKERFDKISFIERLTETLESIVGGDTK